MFVSVATNIMLFVSLKLQLRQISVCDQSEYFTINSLIFSMARDGTRFLGHTSVQFMIVRHRNSR